MELEKPDYDLDVAMSFAGHDREIVREIADRLKREGVRTFFDEDFAVEMWGEDLVEYFEAIYNKRSKYMMMFISTHYAAKAWPGLERKAGLARALESDEVYVLPVRLDDSPAPPGMPPTTAYLDARRMGVEGIAAAFLEKLHGRSGWDGRTPRTQGDIDELLRVRPEGWEYLLWGGTLYVAMQGLEDKYLDHELGYSSPTGTAVSDDSILSVLTDYINEARRLGGQVETILEARVQVRAFGESGEDGDPVRIQHLARRVASVYEDLLDWSARVRSCAVSSVYEDLFTSASRLVDKPIHEYRAFVEHCASELDRVPEYIARPAGSDPVSLDLSLTLSMDEAALQAYEAELARAFS